ncbi:MAG: hypothetical protein QF926_02695 [Alphaproteobacteria bacterium]|jgi:hypothetical protein|nr:hypothetical protein [Alphaproteobacteria bacterium]
MANDHNAGGADDSAIAAAEVRLVYQGWIDDIREHKSRKRSITYYSLILYGALIAALRLIEDMEVFVAIVAVILAALIAAASVMFLSRTQNTLIKCRMRLKAIRREQFTDAGRQAYGDESATSHDVWITTAMKAVSIIVALIVMFIAWQLRT